MMKTAILLSNLRQRIKDMPDNFKDFVRSECQWEEHEYRHYMRHPNIVDPIEHDDILMIAQALADDLQILIRRYRRAIKRGKKK